MTAYHDGRAPPYDFGLRSYCRLIALYRQKQLPTRTMPLDRAGRVT